MSAYVDLRAGGSYRFTITPGNVAAGTFREVEPGRRIVFGWGWDGSQSLPPDASTVTVTVSPADDGGCRVTLVHEGLDEQQEASHAAGWEHYFERLESLAATGDAGRDEWTLEPPDLDPLVATEAVLAAVQPVLRGLTAEDQPKPTTCADYTCHDLVVHLFDSLQQLDALAGVGEVRLDGSVENRVSVLASAGVDAWRSRGLDGDVPGPGDQPMPASVAASILPVELLLHGWDLAQATGQPLLVSDQVVSYVAGLAETVVPGSRSRGDFGPEVEAPPGSTALDRLAAYAGRHPLR